MEFISFQPFLLDVQSLGYIVVMPDRYRHVIVDVLTALFLSEISSIQLNKITEHDIVYSFSGVRPLVKNSKEMNLTTREYIIQKNGNVISVFGGKWTTSRRLAKKVTKKVEYTK